MLNASISNFISLNLVKRVIEAVVRRCSVKKVFLEILQNSPENDCARVSIKKGTLAQVFSCEFCKISKNTFSDRTPPVAASGGVLDFHGTTATDICMKEVTDAPFVGHFEGKLRKH